MTERGDDLTRLLREHLGAVPYVPLVRGKCPRCGRRMLRDPYKLPYPCTLCEPVDGYGTYFDLLLALEFRLSAKAYRDKLDRDGPPWINPKAWIQPRSRWPKLRPPADS